MNTFPKDSNKEKVYFQGITAISAGYFSTEKKVT